MWKKAWEKIHYPFIIFIPLAFFVVLLLSYSSSCILFIPLAFFLFLLLPYSSSCILFLRLAFFLVFLYCPSIPHNSDIKLFRQDFISINCFVCHICMYFLVFLLLFNIKLNNIFYILDNSSRDCERYELWIFAPQHSGAEHNTETLARLWQRGQVRRKPWHDYGRGGR